MYKYTIVSNEVNLYSRFIIKGCVFHTHVYSMSYKNCYVTLVDRKGVFKITALFSVIVRENDEVVEKCVLVFNVLSSQPCVNYDTEVNANLTKHLQIKTSNEQFILLSSIKCCKEMYCINKQQSDVLFYCFASF